MSISAGKLRHRITIESMQEIQDENGDISRQWTPVHENVPAEWVPGPGREYLASEATRAEVDGRFQIRHLPGIKSSMRVLWDGQVWEIKAPPLVDATARREMTLMVGSVEV